MVAEEQFNFNGNVKRKIFTYLGIGVVLFAIGVLGLSNGWWGHREAAHGHGAHHEVSAHEEHGAHADAHGAEAHHEEGHNEHAESAHGGHHGPTPMKRVVMGIWQNSVFFLGIAVCGVFFLAVNYITWAGWSALLKRIFESFGYYLLPGGIILIVTWFLFNHDIFHWTHMELYDEGSEQFDPIIAGKEWYLAKGFFIARMFVYIGGWYVFWKFLRGESILEDKNGGELHHARQINWSAGFVVFFAVSSSMSAWDWVMSIDTHWFSTMFGWYVFASWFVTALSIITYIVVRLKDSGYLTQVNAEHLHDLGKFMFAFSIFWTYIWFSQFILYWYSNIPEETIWFVERLFNNMGVYAPIFVINLVINFVFPFFFFMTRDAKRFGTLLKVGACCLVVGHWFDFYLMMMPGTLNEFGGFDLGMIFMELGLFLIFACIFVFSVLFGLSKAPLVAKNHPFIQESIHHHT